jgi:serine protease
MSLVMVALLFGGQSFSQARENLKAADMVFDGQGHALAGEVVVKFTGKAPEAAIKALNNTQGVSVLRSSRAAGAHRLRVPQGRNMEQVLKAYRQSNLVEYAEPNYIRTAFALPNDPYYPYQWHMDDSANPNPYGGANGGGINVEPAWDVSTGAGVIVAVIDTGVAYENYTERVGSTRKRYYLAPDLAQTTFVPGYDFVNNDAHPNDDNSHGTHVAGTIAQSTNNSTGVAGVAFNASIMPIKVLDAYGSGTDFEVAEGIYYAVDHGAKVLNLSLGGPGYSTTLADAVAYAYQHGVTVVCAAGNDGDGLNQVSYPAGFDNWCIAVAATRYDETRAYYSNYGAYVDVAAPGGDVTVDQNGDGYPDGVLQNTFNPNTKNTSEFGYWFFQGTSMATPHVAGVAALLVSAGASSPDIVRNALESTAEDKGTAGKDDYYGWGIVDAMAAVNAVSVPNTPPVADPGGPYTGTEDIAVTFDGSLSTDAEGDPLTYRWDFGDGATGTGVAPTHVYAAGGTYTVTLIVNDGRSDSVPATTTATITEVNDAPVASAGPDQTGLIGEVLSFDGSASYDIDGAIVSYAWDFGDGATASGVAVQHAYTAVGSYLVTLTVTDDAGAQATDTLVVTIQEQPTTPTMHVADITMQLQQRGTYWMAKTNVLVVDNNGAAVPNASVTGDWSLNGTYLSTVTGSTSTNGLVQLLSPRIKTNSGSVFTFTVTNIQHDTYTYDAAANVETSDSITVP